MISSQKNRIAYEILQHLTIKGETEQTTLPTILRCSYRTILRELKILEQMNYIEFVRKRTTGSRGRPRNVWKATISGLFTYLSGLWEHEDDLIADISPNIIENFRGDLLLFQEWEFFKKDMAIFSQVISFFVLFCMSINYSRKTFNDSLDTAKKYHDDDETRSRYEDVAYVSMFWNMDDLNLQCLGLQAFLETDGESNSEYYKMLLNEYIPYCLQNSSLKEEYEKILEKYDKRYVRYKQLREII